MLLTDEISSMQLIVKRLGQIGILPHAVTYNHGNILELSNNLVEGLIRHKQAVLDIWFDKHCIRVASRSAEKFNLRILGI